MLRISLDDLGNAPFAEKEEPALKIHIGKKKLAFSSTSPPAHLPFVRVKWTLKAELPLKYIKW
jgi:hypothetical protein